MSVLIAFAACVAYMWPANVAFRRRHEARFAIFWLSLFFNWTMLGWFVMLVWAYSGPNRRRVGYVQQSQGVVINNIIQA